MEDKRGKENGAADALSRVQDCEIAAISTPEPSWIAKFKEENIVDPYFQQMRDRMEQGTLDPSKYSTSDGIFWRKGRILLGPTSPLRKQIFDELELHSSPTAGHSGFHNTA